MTMRFRAALAAAFSLLALSPSARADYTVRDGAGANVSFGSFSLSGVQIVKHAIVNPTTGAAVGVSGAPFFVQLSGTNAVTVSNLPATQAIQGIAGGVAVPVSQSGAWSFGLSGAIPAGSNVIGAVTQSGGPWSVSVANFPATQAVSLASAPLPAGAATAANQNATAAGTSASSAQAIQGVTGGVAVPVSGTFFQATQPISATALPLPSGAATSAAQSTGNSSLSSIDTKTPALVSGRVPVDGSGVTQPISASALPLPSGAATSALQTTGNASLASLDTKLPAKGAAATAAALPVTIATDQAAVAVNTVVRATATDRGGTITAGGTAQQFMASNTSRRGFSVQNQSTGDLYVNCLGTAAANQTSLKIPTGALYETPAHHVGTGACSIFGATTGQAFYAREF